MAPITIWGRASSSNVMKLLWLCEELALPYERIDAGGEFGRTRDPGYLAMNPNALVPTLVEADGFSLWESNAILRYLAATRAPGTAFHPADPRARADAERWMDWQLASLNAPMTPLFIGLVRTPSEKRDAATIAAARDRTEALWAIVDARLTDRSFMTGEALTLADIALGVYVHRWFALPIARREMPALAAWYARLLQRKGFREHCAGTLA
ncbi:glutathione S-transferase family protein [Plastoroseomonas hellenica]|uniref:glutathione S-transferase family protein n=1 Tax=Plastoroseomonas hellenica TaxID=2687306 RepID=UPI001BA91C31|nr:glutathione S-transferase [Plastoroseomonas hellenica]MBR0645742.1 glutathione S-transferase [Plastoroseomonas hellenica]